MRASDPLHGTHIVTIDQNSTGALEQLFSWRGGKQNRTVFNVHGFAELAKVEFCDWFSWYRHLTSPNGAIRQRFDIAPFSRL